MAGPLDGVVVADFTQLVQGPFASQVLADLGADVIKIEPPTGDWLRRFAIGDKYTGGESVSFLAFNRNKQSVVLNLKSSEDLATARQIVAGADVLMENFRPGVMERLGLGYEDLKALNPRLVYCASTGYGADGPYQDRPGQDLLIQALTGLPMMNGRADDPPVPVAIGIADLVAGLHMVYGTLAALIERASSGEGQRVDVSLLNSLLAMQSQELVAHMNSDLRPTRPTTIPGSPYCGAPFGLYPTADGHIAIAMNRVDHLMDVLDVPGFESFDEQNITDEHQAGAIRAALTARFSAATTAELVDLLLAADVWCGPLQEFDEVIVDPQVQHNRMIAEVEHPTAGTVRVVGCPTTFSRSEPTIRLAPPLLGEHTKAVLNRFRQPEPGQKGRQP